MITLDDYEMDDFTEESQAVYHKMYGGESSKPTAARKSKAAAVKPSTAATAATVKPTTAATVKPTTAAIVKPTTAATAESTTTATAGSSSVPTDKPTSKTIQKKIAKQEALKDAREKAKASSSKKQKCPTCGGTDHSRSSNAKCPYHRKSKSEAHRKEFNRTSVIKTNLLNCCKSETMISELQELVAHITQAVYAGSIFANYFYLDEVQKLGENDIATVINQDTIYALFSQITGQGKKASEKIKECFKKFIESLNFDFDLEQYKSQGYQTVISIMANQYETLIRNSISGNYEKRTILYFLNLFSNANHELFCGKHLSVAQRKSLASHIYHKKSNPTAAKWPSTVENNKKNKSIVDNAIKHWSTFDSPGSGPPTEANIYANPHLYLRWYHEIQKQMCEKQFITENEPQTTATPGYVYRNLKDIEGVSKLNQRVFRSLKEGVLEAINSNKPLQLSKKLQQVRQDDLEKIRTFIITTQWQIKEKKFNPPKYTDPKGSRMFTLLPLYDCKAKTVQIDAQTFWKVVKKAHKANEIDFTDSEKKDKKDSIPKTPTELDLQFWYSKVFDFSRIGIKRYNNINNNN